MVVISATVCLDQNLLKFIDERQKDQLVGFLSFDKSNTCLSVKYLLDTSSSLATVDFKTCVQLYQE